MSLFAFFDRSRFFKRLTVPKIILPTRTTIQGPFVPALEPVRRKSGAQGELCLRALFTLSYSKKALELFGSAPNIYFLSRAPRPTRMVSWLFVWGGQLGCSVLPLKYTFPEGKRMVSGKATALFYGFFEETCITLCVLQIHIGCHIQEYRAQ